MTEKPNCFSNAVEKTKASCCFSLPFRSHIPPCFYLFPANSSDGLTDTSTSKSYRCSLGGTTPSEVRVNLEARDDRGFDMDLPSRSARASAPSLRPRTASGEREHTILQSLWLEQQQMVTLQRKEEAGFILDKASGRKYRRGKLLGKGAFAKCYELTDLESCAVYAGKIIAKSRLSLPHQREKLDWEVSVHRSLLHENVVAFYDFFEDDRNVFIVIEHCRRKSLDRVLRARRNLTEPEVRYYVRQLVEGCRYIHSQHVIHRDLKLGNMLLNGNMQVKIADFGLATRVKYEGEKKMGVCGTPNYVAPEVLRQEGHSYEVDLWSIGCIIYTMLCGRPPFEMPTLKETFKRISDNKFSLPSCLSAAAKELIKKLLNRDPTARLGLAAILFEDFFTTGYAPASLSPSFCEKSPKFSASTLLPRPHSLATTTLNPWKASNLVKKKSLARKMSSSQVITKSAQRSSETTDHTQPQNSSEHQTNQAKAASTGQTYSLISLYKLLGGCLQRIPTDVIPLPVALSLPVSISKWIDYSNKYGFGFQLSDGSVGVNFNDSTRLILLANGRTLEYVDLSNHVRTLTTSSVSADLEKKVALLIYFGHYMDEHLKDSVRPPSSSASGPSSDGCPPAPVAGGTVFLKRWFRTDEALVLYLSNGTIQVNFLTDHTKLILGRSERRRDGHLVTYINSDCQTVSYRLSQLCQSGCGIDIAVRIRYVRRMLETLINYEEESV